MPRRPRTFTIGEAEWAVRSGRTGCGSTQPIENGARTSRYRGRTTTRAAIRSCPDRAWDAERVRLQFFEPDEHAILGFVRDRVTRVQSWLLYTDRSPTQQPLREQRDQLLLPPRSAGIDHAIRLAVPVRERHREPWR